MNLVPLWDSLAATVESTSPDDRRTMFDARERLADVTERMIAAALAEYEQIEAMNESQPWYNKPQDPLCRQVGTIVREMFRAWADHAEEIYARAKRSPDLTLRPVMADLNRLMTEQGRMRAMLKMTYEGILRSLDEDSRGEGVSIATLRARIKERKEAEQRAAGKQNGHAQRAAREEQVA